MSRKRFGVNLHSIFPSEYQEILCSYYIWNLSDSNGIRTHNHLVRIRTLKHLAKLAKLLSCVVWTYLCGEFECILLLCHLRVSDWICTFYSPECQITPRSKQGSYLKFKWQKRDSNPVVIILKYCFLLMRHDKNQSFATLFHQNIQFFQCQRLLWDP